MNTEQGQLSVVGIQNVVRHIDGGMGIYLDGISEGFTVKNCTIVNRDSLLGCPDTAAIVVRDGHVYGCSDDELIYARAR